MAKKKSAEEQTKALLNKVFEIEGGWEELLGIVQRRGIRAALVDRRLELGLTQADLAKRLDISQSSVSEFESTRYPDPYLSTLRRYAMALDLRIEFDIVDKPKLEPKKPDLGEKHIGGKKNSTFCPACLVELKSQGFDFENYVSYCDAAIGEPVRLDKVHQ